MSVLNFFSLLGGLALFLFGMDTMGNALEKQAGGRLQTIRFQYTGPSIEAVLDRLPTAEIEEQTEDGWIVKAEVFGKGIEMWIRSQGEYVSILKEEKHV